MKYRERKNTPEAMCQETLIKLGLEPSKRGWPDFLAWNKDKFIAVEVKGHKREPLKKDQLRTMKALEKAGITCFRYTPEGGLERFSVARETLLRKLRSRSN